MRSIITTLIFCVASVYTISNSHAARVDKTLDADPEGQIRIEVIDGDVTIIGWDKPKVRVEGQIPDNDNTLVFKTNNKNTRIEIQPESGFWGGWGNSGGGARLTVYSPRNSDLRLEGVSTDFDIKGMLGNIKADAMSGSFDLDGGRGKVDISTVSGDVTVRDSEGKLHLSSVSGDINAEANARYFDAQSVSGDIEARVISTERIELESVSGDIEIQLRLEEDGRLDADTVSGNIDVQFLNDSINAAFDIETGPGGDVKNRLSEDQIEKGYTFSGSVSFKLGNGDSTVNLETMSGSIRIDK